MHPLAIQVPPSCFSPLSSPETKPAAAFHLHSCPPLQRGGTQTWAMNLGIQLLPRLFPTLSPALGPTYPHSRGSLAHVQPGRSGGQTDTNLPLPPIGCKLRLVKEMRTRQQPNLARSSTQRPHQIPSHLLPAVRRPPTTALPLEDPLLPLHGDTYRGNAGTGVRTNSLHSSSLNLLFSLSGPHRCCRSFSKRSLLRLDMMSSGTLGVRRMYTGGDGGCRERV